MAIVLFDMEIGSMIQQPVEHVCAFLPGHPVELDVEWALLVREASIERRARLVARLRTGRSFASVRSELNAMIEVASDSSDRLAAWSRCISVVTHATEIPLNRRPRLLWPRPMLLPSHACKGAEREVRHPRLTQ